jgi:hypothetical protein
MVKAATLGRKPLGKREWMTFQRVHWNWRIDLPVSWKPEQELELLLLGSALAAIGRMKTPKKRMQTLECRSIG